MPFTPVTLRGTFVRPDGTPAPGRVSARLSAAMQDPSTNEIRTRHEQTETLDATGSFSMQLVATDDASITPSGVTYEIRESIGAARFYAIEVPASSPGGILDLADVAPAVTGPAVFTYVLQATHDDLASRVQVLEDTPPGESAHPDLAAHDLLGLASQAELDTEAAARAAADTAVQAAAATDATTKADAAQAAAEAASIPLTQKATADGVATLGPDAKIPSAQLPSLAITSVAVVASEAAMLALAAQEGDVARRTDLGRSFMLAASPATTLANWVPLSDADTGVATVDGDAGPNVVLPTDGAAGTGTKRTLGTGATQAAAGDDTRIVGALQRAGGTMTGPLVLAADGTAALHPVSKQQLDNATSGAAANLATHEADTTNVHGITNTANLVSGDGSILQAVKITQAAYDALGTKVATTLYIIV